MISTSEVSEDEPASFVNIKDSPSVPLRAAPIRRSTRDIKRKKFDDELVDSRALLKPSKRYKADSTSKSSPKMKKTTSVGTNTMHSEIQIRHIALNDVGRWQPTDDLALITAMLQTKRIGTVYQAVKFSCNFSRSEIELRWKALLYDPVVSNLAQTAMKAIPEEIEMLVKSKTLFSEMEENLLLQISVACQPSMETFNQLLLEKPEVFHCARTPKVLMDHWKLLKQYWLLPDQKPLPASQGNVQLSFSDMEDAYVPDLTHHSDVLTEKEAYLHSRALCRSIRNVESDVQKWSAIMEAITGIGPADFDSNTLAVLRGRFVRFLVRSREVTLGRNTKDNQVDIDLSLEGPCQKISRKQATIRLRPTGAFYVTNTGRRPVYINGLPVLLGYQKYIRHNDVLEIATLRFVFTVNLDLINTLRNESFKAMTL